MALHAESLIDTRERQYVIGGTFIAYFIIGVASLLELIGQPLTKFHELFFCVIGVIMFLASGIMAIKYYDDSIWVYKTVKIVCAKGVLALINAVLYTVYGILMLMG